MSSNLISSVIKSYRDDDAIDHGLSQTVFCKGDGDQPSQRDSWQCVTGVSWTETHLSGATHVCGWSIGKGSLNLFKSFGLSFQKAYRSCLLGNLWGMRIGWDSLTCHNFYARCGRSDHPNDWGSVYSYARHCQTISITRLISFLQCFEWYIN